MLSLTFFFPKCMICMPVFSTRKYESPTSRLSGGECGTIATIDQIELILMIQRISSPSFVKTRTPFDCAKMSSLSSEYSITSTTFLNWIVKLLWFDWLSALFCPGFEFVTRGIFSKSNSIVSNNLLIIRRNNDRFLLSGSYLYVSCHLYHFLWSLWLDEHQSDYLFIQ